MFTGLVEGVGSIRGLRRLADDMRLTIEPRFMPTDLAVGDSISVDGVCLTVTGVDDRGFSADVSGETLSRSTLCLRKLGDRVNLEGALRLTDRLGGHLVSGHVDGIGRILSKKLKDRYVLFSIGIDKHLSRYTIEKGSIAVDGISLTVNRCDEGSFEVNVIPQTGKETTILTKKVGDLVNIEVDMIGKYVEKLLHERSQPQGKKSSGIDMKTLMKYGFGG